MRNILNRLRTKGWYWDTLLFLWVSMLFILFMYICAPNVNAQNNNYYEYKHVHVLPGVIGLGAMPVALATVSLRDYQWKNVYGAREPYMTGYKLSSYNQLQRSNSQILLTGLIVTGVGIGIQMLINHKFRNKKYHTSLSCTRFY